MAEKTPDELVAEEACKSRIPVLGNERTLGMRDMIMIQISFSVATWMLLTGAYIGMAAPFWPAFIIAVFGTSVPLMWHCFIGKMHARWGIDGSILARATWGPIGAALVIPLFLFVQYMVWTSIPIVMFGRTAEVALSYTGADGWYTDPRLWACLGFCVSLTVLWKGAAVLFFFFRFVTPTIVSILVVITIRTIVVKGWTTLTHIIPAGLNADGFAADPDMSFMIGSEVAIGLGFSWVFCFAIYGRLAKTEAVAWYGSWFGWGPMWGILCAPAILAALAAGVTDPVYLLEGANPAWIALYLVFLFCANIFSAVCTMYIVSLSLRTLFPKIPWGAAVLLNLLVVILIFWPAAYDQFGKFISFVGAAGGALGGVMVVDYFLKKFQLNLREVYTQKKGSGYWYFFGVNIPAFIAFGCGAGFSIWLYNPFTLAVSNEAIFKVMGAAIPGCIIGSVVYFGLASLFLVPKKIGFPAVPRPGKPVAPMTASAKTEAAPGLASGK